MEEKIRIAGVSERDIDLLLLEEFHSSADFCEWFLQRTGLSDAHKLSFVAASRSVTHSTGESDLEITLSSKSGEQLILLIENKVNAGFQPNQVERYKKRGTSYLRQGKANQYITILVAPKSYSPDSKKGFDARVNYEDFVDWFENNKEIGKRRTYKISLLSSAIEKSASGYQMVADAPVMDFWKEYWRLSLEIAPELQMQEPANRPATSTFIYFPQAVLPKGVKLCHKLTKGFFDLAFEGMGCNLMEMNSKYGPHLNDGMKIVKTEKSASIRVEVPILSVADPFKEQKEKAIEAMIAGKELFNWFQKTH